MFEDRIDVAEADEDGRGGDGGDERIKEGMVGGNVEMSF